MKRLLLVVAAFLSSPVVALGQDDFGDPSARRSATVLAGAGNAMGWLGAQAELYFSGDRLSAFAGLGYTPALGEGDPSGITGAAGLRAYTNGLRHRAFLELSVSQVAVRTGAAVEDKRFYGPGVQVGYQYTALSGFTLLASVGVGVALGVDEGVSPVYGLGGLGFGYTWR